MINLIYYNDELRCYRDGVVERKFKTKGWQQVKITANCNGYNLIGINNKKPVFRQRLIAYCFMVLDTITANSNKMNLITHKDFNKLNNCVENLTLTNACGVSVNMATTKGYSFNKKMNKYQARIGVNGKQKHLGLFDTAEEAHKAYVTAKKINYITRLKK